MKNYSHSRYFLILFFHNHYGFLLAAIDHDVEGSRQADVADVLCFLLGWQRVEDVLPVDAVASEVVDG